MSLKILKNLLIQTEYQNKIVEIQNKNFPLMAIDYGEKYCGLAFSPDSICYLPLKIVTTTELLITVQKLIESKGIKVLVFGLPFGSECLESNFTHKIRYIARKIKKQNKIIDLKFVNERDSSQLSKATILQQNTPKRIDDLAACRILQFYLESN